MTCIYLHNMVEKIMHLGNWQFVFNSKFFSKILRIDPSGSVQIYLDGKHKKTLLVPISATN